MLGLIIPVHVETKEKKLSGQFDEIRNSIGYGVLDE